MQRLDWDRVWRDVSMGLLFFWLLLWIRGEPFPPRELKPRLNHMTAAQAFNFARWELEALGNKVAVGLLAPQRFMTEEQRAQFVLEYLDDVRAAYRLADDIERAYVDPEIDDPATATAAQQAELAAVRAKMTRTAPIAEAILGEQVSSVLNAGGFGALQQILPPVSGAFTPLPLVLVISPRDRIESVYQAQLVAGLTAAEQEALEARVAAEFPDYSAYITEIGGLAVYPAMLLESSSVDWIADVIAHEWTHHYLLFHPLGLYYDRSGETRTINETTASLVGEWAGQEVILRYYAPLLAREKSLPNPLYQEAAEPQNDSEPQRFDFRAEMHHTRVMVDQMLAEGRINEAEWYMEFQRRYFVANGYSLRKLNQAYFAFHGAYAASPGGAAGKDPIGPAVRALWAISPTPRDFVHTVAPFTTLAELNAALP